MGRRDEEFHGFYEAEFPRLYRLAFLLGAGREEAEDLAQEAMVRTYRSWNRIRERSNPGAYARTVMVNHRRSLARRARAHQKQPSTVSDQLVHLDEEHVVLWEELGRLTKPQRQAIVLRYYEDLSEAETAEVMRCPVGTVKSHVRRGLGRLRAGLRDDADASPESREPV